MQLCFFLSMSDPLWRHQFFPLSNRHFADFCHQLHHIVPRLTLWAARVEHDDLPPLLTEVILTEPLRTPPAVTAEVEKSARFSDGGVRGYSGGPCPLPSAGPAPLYLHHTARPPHSGGPLIGCRHCGGELARVLREDLHVGVTGVCVCTCVCVCVCLLLRV